MVSRLNETDSELCSCDMTLIHFAPQSSVHAFDPGMMAQQASKLELCVPYAWRFYRTRSWFQILNDVWTALVMGAMLSST